MAILVTIFEKLLEVDQPRYLSLESALDRIRKGIKSESIVLALRQAVKAGNKSQQADLKKRLPCVCFSGRFTRRANEAIVTHSGLLILDFDNLPDVEKSKAHLITLPFIYAVWLSPSGTGLKALVMVEPNPTAHRGYFTALQAYLADMGIELDPSGKDVARVCFESYDPDIYVNPDAETWIAYELPVDTPPVAPQNVAKATDFGRLNTCANMIRNAPEGQRHHVLVKAATLAGGYIGAGQVIEADAVALLSAEFRKRPVDANYQVERTITDQIAYGKTRPIYDQIAEEEVKPKTTSTHNVKFLSGSWDKMKAEFRDGKPHGRTTHQPGMDGRFSWKKGEHTLISGYPGAGKSEWAYYLMLLMSVHDDWKWAVFAPENEPESEFFDTLIHALVGKSVDKSYTNQMSIEQYAEAANFIEQHFFLVSYKTSPTIEEVEADFVYCIESFGANGVLIDPHNAIDHDEGSREDQYLRKYLNRRAAFAELHNVVYITTCHPNGNRKPNSKGEYDPLKYYDLSGGSMWANKIHNFMVVHRPYQNADPANADVDIIVRKVKKQKLVGIPGTVNMNFNRATNRYYTDGISGLDFINSEAPGLNNGPLKP